MCPLLHLSRPDLSSGQSEWVPGVVEEETLEATCVVVEQEAKEQSSVERCRVCDGYRPGGGVFGFGRRHVWVDRRLYR